MTKIVKGQKAINALEIKKIEEVSNDNDKEQFKEQLIANYENTRRLIK